MLQEEIVVGRKTQVVVVLYMLVDLEDQVSAVGEDIDYLEDIVRPEWILQGHLQLGSWQTCRRLSSCHNLEELPIRLRAFVDDQDEEASSEKV